MSLDSAVSELRQRLLAGWWPDWRPQKNRFPKDWDNVALSMISAFDMDALR